MAAFSKSGRPGSELWIDMKYGRRNHADWGGPLMPHWCSEDQEMQIYQLWKLLGFVDGNHEGYYIPVDTTRLCISTFTEERHIKIFDRSIGEILDWCHQEKPPEADGQQSCPGQSDDDLPGLDLAPPPGPNRALSLWSTKDLPSGVYLDANGHYLGFVMLRSLLPVPWKSENDGDDYKHEVCLDVHYAKTDYCERIYGWFEFKRNINVALGPGDDTEWENMPDPEPRLLHGFRRQNYEGEAKKKHTIRRYCLVGPIWHKGGHALYLDIVSTSEGRRHGTKVLFYPTLIESRKVTNPLADEPESYRFQETFGRPIRSRDRLLAPMPSRGVGYRWAKRPSEGECQAQRMGDGEQPRMCLPGLPTLTTREILPFLQDTPSDASVRSCFGAAEVKTLDDFILLALPEVKALDDFIFLASPKVKALDDSACGAPSENALDDSASEAGVELRNLIHRLIAEMAAETLNDYVPKVGV